MNKKNVNLRNQLLKEHKEFKKKCIQLSIDKEEKRNEFLKHKKVVNKNKKTLNNMFFDTEKNLKSYSKEIEQRMLLNKTIAVENELIGFFFTNTLPSSFHPFKSTIRGKKLKEISKLKWGINKKYKFNNLEDSMTQGQRQLNEFFRIFYLKLKKGKREFYEIAKKIKYDFIIEYHNTYIPHSHYLIYIPKEMEKYLKECWSDTIEEMKFNKVAQKKEKIKNIHATGKYLIKYIHKILRSKNNDLRVFDGWRKKLNTRIYRSSNTKITMNVYRKIYNNFTEEDRELLIKKSKLNNSCLLYEIQKHTNIFIKTFDKNEEKIDYIKKFSTEKKLYTVIINREKEKTIDLNSVDIRIDFKDYFDIYHKNNGSFYYILEKIKEMNEKVFRTKKEEYNIKKKYFKQMKKILEDRFKEIEKDYLINKQNKDIRNKYFQYINYLDKFMQSNKSRYKINHFKIWKNENKKYRKLYSKEDFEMIILIKEIETK